MSKNFKKPESAQPSIEFVRPAQLAEEGKTGTVVEGTFVETLKNRFDESKLDYKFETEKGDTVIINHTGSLAYQMKSISPGDYCQVNYNGKITLEKGKMKGKEAHDFEVLIAE